MNIQIQAVDVDRVSSFWRRVHHQDVLSVVKGDAPALRPVVTPISRDLAEEVESLVGKGAEFVKEIDGGVLMKDPEGNEFIVEPNADLVE